jgi:hypothetical protein
MNSGERKEVNGTDCPQTKILVFRFPGRWASDTYGLYGFPFCPHGNYISWWHEPLVRIGEIVMRAVLFVMSIVAAVAVGLWQGPGVDTADHVATLSGGGCYISGYSSINCSAANSNCTSGTQDAATYQTTAGQAYQAATGSHLVGSCTGSSGCTVTATDVITRQGCGG